MSKDTFLFLCSQLRPYIKRKDTRFRKSITVEKRLAVTLWCLATPCEYWSISHLFGIGRSTVCEIVHSTCQVIVDQLLSQYINFPSGPRLDSIVSGFNHQWGIPQCAGAIDGTHFPVCAPILNHTDYYNRKGYYSINMQAVVDHQYRFLDIYVGWPGSVHDARVFSHSSLYSKGESGTLLPSSEKSIQPGVKLPVFIVGDSAYPLLNWLMKPYPQSLATSRDRITYNYRISRARIVVENAFGRLKGRWRRLLKRNDMLVENISTVVAAACVLHNICEMHNKPFNDAWLLTDTDEQTQSQAHHSHGTATNQQSDQQIQAALEEYFKTIPL